MKEQWNTPLGIDALNVSEEMTVFASARAEIECGLFRDSAKSPEGVLLEAVLQDAISTIQKHQNSKNVRKRREAREAVEWMKKDSKQTGGISFEMCCAGLALSESWVRRQVKIGNFNMNLRQRVRV